MWSSDPLVLKQSNRRRTFAIIAHPDAGKTTLTEKLLLYGGQLDVAGMVRGRKTNRAVTSDWMELERQRGISITSTVLTFEYRGHLLNLVDTPGHQDFSEDTYRALYAADCAVMVLDFAKGVEPQTEKLFSVCARRGIPVLTFVNKVDRFGRDPFELLDEIEVKFGMQATPFNWPIGSGRDFRGLVDRRANSALLYADQYAGDRVVEYRTVPLSGLSESDVGATELEHLRSSLDLLDGAGTGFSLEAYLAGRQTPVFFGSALNNYGIENFLDHFLEISPSPTNRPSDHGPVPVDRSEFSGFVFKIQANLNPHHRDRVAYVRICTGRFDREMEVVQSRTGRRLKVRSCHRVFANERETMDEAYPGDILGLVNPGLHLGDSICVGKPINFEPLPQFPPEQFAEFRCTETRRRKQFAAGIQQLAEEGAIQVFYPSQTQQGEPILAAVGELQFDVVKYRLETEYNTQVAVRRLPFVVAKWVHSPAGNHDELKLNRESRTVVDSQSHPVVLFTSELSANFYARENPQFEFRSVSSLSNFYDTRTPLE